MIVGYARVSTQKAEQEVSIELQVKQLWEHGCEHVIAEQRSAYSEKEIRPGWEELQQLVASGKAKVVVAVSQSRLSRRDDVIPFLRLCARKEVEVRFLDGTPGDVDNPAAKMLTGVMAVVNEVDSQIKSINSRNGIKRRQAEGHYSCKSVPFGYTTKKGDLLVDHKNWKAARELWDILHKHEFVPTQAVRREGLNWSPEGLHKWINHPMLRGWVRGVPGKIDRLISPEEYAHAKRLMDKRKKSRVRQPRKVRLFTGLARCGKCGSALAYKQDKKGKNTYLRCHKATCEWYSKVVRVADARQCVIDALRGAASSLQSAVDVPKETTPQSATAEQLELQSQLEGLLDLQARGVPGLDTALSNLRAQLAAEPAVNAPTRWSDFLVLIQAPGLLEASSDDDLRAVFLELVEEVAYVGRIDSVRVTLRDAVGDDAQ